MDASYLDEDTWNAIYTQHRLSLSGFYFLLFSHWSEWKELPWRDHLIYLLI